jgi:hypothetical protein
VAGKITSGGGRLEVSAWRLEVLIGRHLEPQAWFVRLVVRVICSGLRRVVECVWLRVTCSAASAFALASSRLALVIFKGLNVGLSNHQHAPV